MTIFNGTYAAGIILASGTTTNPSTVTVGSYVTNTNTSTLGSPADGIYGQPGVAWTLSNFGAIRVIGSYSSGIELAAGGVVNNGSSGATGAFIFGGRHGVKIAGGAGTVTNFGTIEGGKDFSGTGNSAAIYLGVGGSVVNSGLVMATGTAHAGVAVFTAAGYVTNLGTIQGATAGGGIHLHVGGTVINGSIGVTTAVIAGGGVGVRISAAPGTVVNFATIANTVVAGGAGVYLEAGGAVTNQSSGKIAGLAVGVAFKNTAGTIANFGTITSTTTGSAGAGVYLGEGGVLTNQANGLITAYRGAVSVKGSSAAIVNFGTLRDTGKVAPAVFVGSGGTLTNRGLITSTSGAVNFSTTAGTVDNFATIISTLPVGTAPGAGVYLGSGGLITNAAGASITALRAAISIGGTAATSAAVVVNNAGTVTGIIGVLVGLADTGSNTIVNSGRITGTGGTAVQFGAGNDTLIVKPGAVFNGAVSGGGGTNTIIQFASGTLKVTGFSAFKTIRLANGGADSLTLTGANFTGVGGHVITVDDGNSGNTVTASTLPSADAIVVRAGTGVDTLKGGAGNDIFYAGGKTTMTGGAGANQFSFAHIGTNKITDFGASAKNELVLRKSGFNLGADESLATGTPKHLAASVFIANSTGTFTTTSQRFAYNKTTGKLSYSAHGSGSAPSTVVTLTGHPSLSAGPTGNLFFTS